MTLSDEVQFDKTGYIRRGNPPQENPCVWQTPDGDGLGIFYFALPPDLPTNASSIDELVALYRERLALVEDSRLVELEVVSAGECPAVRTIISVPQQPSGRTYVGSLTIPFRDFSFVLKCQCAERGTTGVKETILLNRKMAAGELPVIHDDGSFTIPNWNPDDPGHDTEFPDHPVAHARRTLAHLTRSLHIADRIRAMPGFALPEAQR